jgi:hypothetical protein
MGRYMKYLILQLAAAMTTSVWADSPIAPPEKHSVLSANEKYEVVSDPKQGTKSIEKSTQRILWEMPKWHRYLFLSNNGEYAASVYDGYLLPLSYDKKMTLLTFYKNGKVVREVPVEEIVNDSKILIRTTSHYQWGEIVGFNEGELLRIRLNDQNMLLFNPETGRKHEVK